jgi:hypothetical protein
MTMVGDSRLWEGRRFRVPFCLVMRLPGVLQAQVLDGVRRGVGGKQGLTGQRGCALLAHPFFDLH